MKIGIIGTGYVGLVTGTCFAEMGNHVTCIDLDQEKVARLRKGESPIYEPGLAELLSRNIKEGRLLFNTKLAEVIDELELIFIAVGTPSLSDGSCDLSYVEAVAAQIGELLNHNAIIVTKSTIPVGTTERVAAIISEKLKERGLDIDFEMVNNPEFLKQGNAVKDFMSPDRVIIGASSERAGRIMRELYQPFTLNHDRTLVMDIRSSELTKYVANSFLAMKISFMNEMSGLCERLGADIENIRQGIGSDQRIGYSFIYAGCGYGGSCFPKDVKALVDLANDAEFDPAILTAVNNRNELQKQVLFEKIQKHYGPMLEGLRLAIWGLAFKPGTDDVRDAPSIVLAKALLEAGVELHCYDPVAVENFLKEIDAQYIDSGQIKIVDDPYDALDNADGMVLVTEWKSFRVPDFDKMKSLMRKPIVFDGRNQYNPERLRTLGFTYYGIGRTLIR